MRLLTFIALLSSFTVVSGQTFFEKTDSFFGQYVNNGLIDYERIVDNPSRLNDLVASVAEFRIAGTTPQEQKAFYTNAYNILVIKQVVDNYPVEGPMEIEGFFDKTTFTVAGRTVTLDALEKEILFPAFPDPRLHFVLVCAAIGCPPIAAYAYVPDSLETQLDKKTREVLNINWYVRVYKNKTLISRVFDWYEDDFLNDTTSVKAYINRYREIQIPESHTLENYPYDWSLNDSKNSFRY